MCDELPMNYDKLDKCNFCSDIKLNKCESCGKNGCHNCVIRWRYVESINRTKNKKIRRNWQEKQICINCTVIFPYCKGFAPKKLF